MNSSPILHCKDRLEEQLVKAKESLKGVDCNLKKFITRTVSSNVPLRSAFSKTSVQISNDKWKSNREDNFIVNSNSRRRPARVLGDADIENIPIKKRLGPKILHSSINGPPRDDGPRKPVLSSCVIAKPYIVPSRNEAMSVKTYTETRARDRRMFGALLGTLQKFRQEETQLKDKEEKKAMVEKKLEETAKREKEKIRVERQKLMDLKKKKEAYIRAVENNMKLIKEQEEWEELQRPLFNYIRTETKPSICYLPKILTDKTSELLKKCQEELTKLIEEKRESLKEEVDTLISQWNKVETDDLNGDKEITKSPQCSAVGNSTDDIPALQIDDVEKTPKSSEFIEGKSENLQKEVNTLMSQWSSTKTDELSIDKNDENSSQCSVVDVSNENILDMQINETEKNIESTQNSTTDC